MRRDLGVDGVLAPALAVGLCLVSAGILAALGRTRAAAGVGLGVLLFLANTILFSATFRLLVARDAPSGAPVLAAASSLVRLLFLGAALGAIAVFLGKEVFLGAGGGLAAAQISLLLKRSGSKGGA